MVKKISNKIPLGIKVISIYYFIIVLSAVFVIIKESLKEILSSKSGIVYVIVIGGLVLATVGPFIILFFFIGFYLWKSKKWSKVLAIIVSAFFAVISIVEIVTSKVILNFITFPVIEVIEKYSWLILIISLAQIVYLLFNKKAKEFFKK